MSLKQAGAICFARCHCEIADSLLVFCEIQASWHILWFAESSEPDRCLSFCGLSGTYERRARVEIAKMFYWRESELEKTRVED